MVYYGLVPQWACDACLLDCVVAPRRTIDPGSRLCRLSLSTFTADSKIHSGFVSRSAFLRFQWRIPLWGTTANRSIGTLGAGGGQYGPVPPDFVSTILLRIYLV
jgi:hypothetical protein